MKILFVGLGSMAHRHIKNIKMLYPVTQVSVWRQSCRDKEIGEIRNCIEKIFFEKEEVLHWNPDVVFLTNPAPFHVEIALMFARMGSHLFIEKPMSTSLEGVDLLLQECKERQLTIMVGYVLRFLKPLNIIKQVLLEGHIGKVLFIRSAVGQYLCDWRPSVDYRKTVSAQKKLGGGALFELSHELDYMRWLVGEIQAVNAITSKASDLDLDVEDTTEILLKFRCGALGSVHLDMIDRAKNRSCRVIGTQGTLKWDVEDDHRVKLYLAEKKEWVELYSDPKMDSNEIYLEELRHFFRCIERGTEPFITGEEGKRVLNLILAAKQSAQEKREIFL